MDLVELRPRKIVDRVTRPSNELDYLLDPHLTGIASLQRASSPESKQMDTEDNRLEDRCKYRIEWTIDEDVAVVFRIDTRHYFADFPRFAWTALAHARSSSKGIVPP